MTARSHIVTLIAALLAALAPVSSCGPDRPEDVVDATIMERLLYDYHVGQALARTHRDSVHYYTTLYNQAALRKHSVTAQQFEKSLEWYTRHADVMFEVYKNIDERISTQTASSASSESYSGFGTEGDTVGVWQGPTFCLLSNQGQNRLTYRQEGDTTFRPGDRLMLHLNALWVSREGNRQAYAGLSVHYEGDSVATVTKELQQRNPQELSLTLAQRPVDHVSCFVYFPAHWTERPKFLALSDLALIRFRAKSSAAEEEAPFDKQTELTLPADAPTLQPRTPEQRLRDSLLRQDTLMRRPRTLRPPVRQ